MRRTHSLVFWLQSSVGMCVYTSEGCACVVCVCACVHVYLITCVDTQSHVLMSVGVTMCMHVCSASWACLRHPFLYACTCLGLCVHRRSLEFFLMCVCARACVRVRARVFVCSRLSLVVDLGPSFCHVFGPSPANVACGSCMCYWVLDGNINRKNTR